MECLAVTKLPAGSDWIWEIKLDGYRAEAVECGGHLFLLSRRQKSFSKQFPLIYEALADLPDNTVIDGEIVALDEAGKPDFNLLQNFRSATKRINYFVFDLLVLEGRDVTSLPLVERHPPPGGPTGLGVLHPPLLKRCISDLHHPALKRAENPAGYNKLPYSPTQN